jgi:hypothetical protein
MVIGALSFFGVLGACHTYVESRTPSGSIPAPVPAAGYGHEGTIRDPDPRTLEPLSNEISGDVERIQPETGVGRSPTPVPSESVSTDDDAATSRFRTFYNSQGRPRIAVFLNRELSDDVLEWKTTDSCDHPEPATLHEPRLDPGEDWMWQFETGFMKPLLDEGVRLVDHATIMRLAAAAAGPQGPRAPLARKKLELDALKGHADYFMEILVKSAPASAYGYDFYVAVKEVATGVILAQETTAGQEFQERIRTEERLATTNRGYEYETHTSRVLLPLSLLAGDLALQVMSELSRQG